MGVPRRDLFCRAIHILSLAPTPFKHHHVVLRSAEALGYVLCGKELGPFSMDEFGPRPGRNIDLSSSTEADLHPTPGPGFTLRTFAISELPRSRLVILARRLAIHDPDPLSSRNHSDPESDCPDAPRVAESPPAVHPPVSTPGLTGHPALTYQSGVRARQSLWPDAVALR